MSKRTLIILGTVGLMIGFLGVYSDGVSKSTIEQKAFWSLKTREQAEAIQTTIAVCIGLQVGGGILGIIGIGMMVLGATMHPEGQGKYRGLSIIGLFIFIVLLFLTAVISVFFISKFLL